MSTVVDPGGQLLVQRRTPCLARLDAARPWSPTWAVTVGDRHVGIRTTGDPAATEALAQRLSGARVPALDDVVRPNFSVEFGAPGGGRSHGLHLVYRDHEVVARRRDMHRLIEDLVALLCADCFSDRTDLLVVQAVAVIHDGSATLLPLGWHRRLLLHQERLTDGTMRMRTPTAQWVDGARAELVHGLHLDGTPSARTPIHRGVVRTQEAAPQLRPGSAVQALFPSVANVDQLGPGPALRTMGALVQQVPFEGVGPVDDADLLALTRRLACLGRTPGG